MSEGLILAGMGDGSLGGGAALRQALFDSLTAILSPNQEVRNAGEKQLKTIEITEGKLLLRGYAAILFASFNSF